MHHLTIEGNNKMSLEWLMTSSQDAFGRDQAMKQSGGGATES